MEPKTPSAPIESATIRAMFGNMVNADVLAEYDTAYPDCLCVIVLDDVGPQKMSDAVQAALKLGVPRICANVVEKGRDQSVRNGFASGGFQAAWAESWNVNIATVRT